MRDIHIPFLALARSLAYSLTVFVGISTNCSTRGIPLPCWWRSVSAAWWSIAATASYPFTPECSIICTSTPPGHSTDTVCDISEWVAYSSSNSEDWTQQRSELGHSVLGDCRAGVG